VFCCARLFEKHRGINQAHHQAPPKRQCCDVFYCARLFEKHTGTNQAHHPSVSAEMCFAVRGFLKARRYKLSSPPERQCCDMLCCVQLFEKHAGINQAHHPRVSAAMCFTVRGFLKSTQV